jgi:CUG-BP- and ETR3-like factor
MLLLENKIFVGMLPKDITEEMVTRLFEPFGEITGVFVIKSTDGYRKGCAFVKFIHSWKSFLECNLFLG